MQGNMKMALLPLGVMLESSNDALPLFISSRFRAVCSCSGVKFRFESRNFMVMKGM